MKKPIAFIALAAITAGVWFFCNAAEEPTTTEERNTDSIIAPQPFRTAPPDPDASASSQSVVATSVPISFTPANSSPPAIRAFRSWAIQYFETQPDQRAARLDEGVRLATTHRMAIKELILTDPRAALENAVPVVLRQQLPAKIVDVLEQRVSGKGPLETYVATPIRSDEPTVVQRQVTLDGKIFVANLSGQRARLMRLPEITLHGVAVDRDLAVSEAPVRTLEVGEMPDTAKQLVQVCPISGTTTEATPATVTAETPAVELARLSLLGGFLGRDR